MNPTGEPKLLQPTDHRVRIPGYHSTLVASLLGRQLLPRAILISSVTKDFVPLVTLLVRPALGRRTHFKLLTVAKVAPYSMRPATNVYLIAFLDRVGVQLGHLSA